MKAGMKRIRKIWGKSHIFQSRDFLVTTIRSAIKLVSEALLLLCRFWTPNVSLLTPLFESMFQTLISIFTDLNFPHSEVHWITCFIILLISLLIFYIWKWEVNLPLSLNITIWRCIAVFLKRQAAAQYWALASIIPVCERFSWKLSF